MSNHIIGRGPDDDTYHTNNCDECGAGTDNAQDDYGEIYCTECREEHEQSQSERAFEQRNADYHAGDGSYHSARAREDQQLRDAGRGNQCSKS